LSILSKNDAIIVTLILITIKFFIYLHAELNSQWPIDNNDDEDNGNNHKSSSLLTTQIKVIPAFNAT
jgi:hypothetical protein